jgi:hypothetical protein
MNKLELHTTGRLTLGELFKLWLGKHLKLVIYFSLQPDKNGLHVHKVDLHIEKSK